jgi:hypothetical protein
VAIRDPIKDNAVRPAIVVLVMVVRIGELHQTEMLTQQRRQKKRVPDLPEVAVLEARTPPNTDLYRPSAGRRPGN